VIMIRTVSRSPAVVAGMLAGVMFVAGVVAGRAGATEFELLVEILELEPGARVADVGAGDGAWAVQLADYVGEEGHVWATEIGEDEVEEIEGRVLGAFLDNVTVVFGGQSDTGLPESCCDVILLRLVYHHFIRPEEMRASLRQALRPGGLIAVIDVTPQTTWRDLPDVPDRGGHGIPPEELIDEMSSDGFEVVARQEGWNGDDDRFCVIFRR